jgi:hypothetical protein
MGIPSLPSHPTHPAIAGRGQFRALEASLGQRVVPPIFACANFGNGEQRPPAISQRVFNWQHLHDAVANAQPVRGRRQMKSQP